MIDGVTHQLRQAAGQVADTERPGHLTQTAEQDAA
jgi:hypothetical protein